MPTFKSQTKTPVNMPRQMILLAALLLTNLIPLCATINQPTFILEPGDCFTLRHTRYISEEWKARQHYQLNWAEEQLFRYDYIIKFDSIGKDFIILKLYISNPHEYIRRKDFDRESWQDIILSNPLFLPQNSILTKDYSLLNINTYNPLTKTTFLIKLSNNKNAQLYYDNATHIPRKKNSTRIKEALLPFTNILNENTVINFQNNTIKIPYWFNTIVDSIYARKESYFGGVSSLIDSVDVTLSTTEDIKLISNKVESKLQAYKNNFGATCYDTLNYSNVTLQAKVNVDTLSQLELYLPDNYCQISSPFAYLGNFERTYTLDKDSLCQFSISLSMDRLEYFQLILNQKKIPICVSPGDNLHLTNHFLGQSDTLIWNGTGSNANNYLINEKLVLDELKEKYPWQNQHKPYSTSDYNYKTSLYYNESFYSEQTKLIELYHQELFALLEKNKVNLPLNFFLAKRSEYQLSELMGKLRLYKDWFYANHNNTIPLPMPDYMFNFQWENELLVEANNFPEFLNFCIKNFEENGRYQIITNNYSKTSNYVGRYLKIISKVDYSFFGNQNPFDAKINDYLQHYSNTILGARLQGIQMILNNSKIGHKVSKIPMTTAMGNIEYLGYTRNYRTLIIGSSIQNVISNLAAFESNIKYLNDNGYKLKIICRANSYYPDSLKQILLRSKLGNIVFTPTPDEQNRYIKMYGATGQSKSYILDKKGYIISNQFLVLPKSDDTSKIKNFVQRMTKISDYTNASLQAKRLRSIVTVLIIFITISSIVWLIAFNKSKRKKQQQLIQTRIRELELKAIRAQLNPHFMFNTLASVQNLVAKNNNELALSYLADFGHLVRLTLRHTEQDEIPLKDELSAIEIYLRIENLRFDFMYQIQIQPDIDVDNIYVPPMILQPFVENAIMHGLYPKNGSKHLSIDLSEDKHHLQIIIEDNGIGRALAQQNKSNNGKAIKMMSERFHLLNQQFDEKYQLKIDDKFENNKPTGTRIIISLPSD